MAFFTDMRLHEQLREAEIEIGRLRTELAERKAYYQAEVATLVEHNSELMGRVSRLERQLGVERPYHQSPPPERAGPIDSALLVFVDYDTPETVADKAKQAKAVEGHIRTIMAARRGDIR